MALDPILHGGAPCRTVAEVLAARAVGSDQKAAHLIAAAPNLYLALENLLTIRISGAPLSEWSDTRVIAALSALAKAEGR